MSSDKSKNGQKGTGGGDRDEIDVLPLSIIPLTSNTLKGAKLVKNSRMQTAVELHSDPVTGSLQIRPEDISSALSAPEKDRVIISQLASLHSYDVYSLRSSLKKLGISVEPADLDLSDKMKVALKEYSVAFTHPLIEKIFGTGRVSVNEDEGLQKIFRDPDVARVRENLKIMTQNTGIPLEDIPKFIEEYSDVFLSVAYYKFSFDNLKEDLDRFLFWIHDLRKHREVTSSPQTNMSCKRSEELLRFLAGSIHERLERFQKSFETFWTNINKNSFETLRGQIEDNHASMGSVLCGLMVKMKSWTKEFPDNTVGGPAKRAKFVMTELHPGLEKLKDMENEARKRVGLQSIKI